MKYEELYKIIKKEFCNLFSYKIHGNGRTIEILTPNSTITDKFVSVFITLRNDRFIITDGGWIENNYYEADDFNDDPVIIQNLIEQYKSYYKIKTTNSPDNKKVYFKELKSVDSIPSSVFDLANFISGVVNIHSLELREKKEKEERDKFKTNLNEYLKEIYPDKFHSRHEIEGVKFSGVIKERSRIHLIEYVTGSSNQYFDNDLRKAAVNFDIVSGSKLKNSIGEKIAIFNDNSLGYQKPSLILIEYLRKNLTTDFLTWKNKEEIHKIITPN